MKIFSLNLLIILDFNIFTIKLNFMIKYVILKFDNCELSLLLEMLAIVKIFAGNNQ